MSAERALPPFGATEYARGLGYLGSAERIRSLVFREYGWDFGLTYCQAIIDRRARDQAPYKDVTDPTLYCRVCEEALNKPVKDGTCADCKEEERSRRAMLKAITRRSPPTPPPAISTLLTLPAIIQAAAHVFGIPAQVITGHDRREPFVRARHAVCLIAREVKWLPSGAPRWSYSQIGRALGGRDHSTVIHGQQITPKYAKRDAAYADRINRLRQLVTEMRP